MKELKFILLFCLLAINCSISVMAQVPETPVNNTTEQQIEDLTNANDDNVTEDDVWLQQLIDFKKNPININTADEPELKQLRVLSQLQITSLLKYRNVVGVLVNILELQAVPNWDVETIKKVLPYINVKNGINISDFFNKRFKGGENSLLLRLHQVVEKAKGFTDSTSTGNFYPGSPQRLFFRYRYSYKNLLQYGVVGEKDPGEQFFKGTQNSGFDFYSAHLFARNIGKIKTLALGDFTVNMGQGLIQWQGLAFRKSSDAMMVKKYSPVLRPYNAAGEFNFFRGAGATIGLGKNTQLTVFGSLRNRDANVLVDTSLFNNTEYASSLQTSGYHRTKSELADKNAIQQLATGATLQFNKKNGYYGVNAILYNYNKDINKAAVAYNLFAINGKQWFNASIDYSYTYKNAHFFGESAISKNDGYAFLNGILLSIDPKVDLSIVTRNINKKFQAIAATAFTESTLPNNESGIYTGITIRPIQSIKMDAYVDFYQFPFLKYRVDAPSKGNDYLLQIGYKPNKVVDAYIRYRTETKQSNYSGLFLPSSQVIGINKKSARAHISYKVNTSFTVKQRAEMIWYDNKGLLQSNGFSTYTDFNFKPLLKPFEANIRLQYFETDDYNSRIYAFENDVLYSFSIPAIYDKGWRYYTNMSYDINRNFSVWLRWAQTIYQNKTLSGSGLDEIKGNKHSEFKIQARLLF